MEELITFEIAKIAKNKGFNWIVLFGLDNNGNRIQFDIEGGYSNWNEYDNKYSAPTQSHLQKWLREVHNIHVNALPYNDEEGSQTLYENQIVDVKDNYNKFSDYTFYHTYELALEAGLLEGLKLIK